MSMNRIGKYTDISGRTFGRLTAIQKVGENNDGRAIWLFQCSCGNQHTVNIKDVVNGHSQSCGCLASELLAKRNYKHGQTTGKQTKEYRTWAGIKQRVRGNGVHQNKYYRSRGIKMSKRWFDSFEEFYKDMGKAPTPKHEIDRIDVNGHYIPSNCRWVTKTEQMNNTTYNKRITYNGRTQTQSEWARELNLPNSNVILKRLKRGWSIEKTLTTPLLSDWRVNDWRKQS